MFRVNLLSIHSFFIKGWFDSKKHPPPPAPGPSMLVCKTNARLIRSSLSERLRLSPTLVFHPSNLVQPSPSLSAFIVRFFGDLYICLTFFKDYRKLLLTYFF